MVASLIMIPVVVRELSRSGYGVAAMVVAVASVFELLSSIPGRALQRYIPQDLATGDPLRFNRTFSTGGLGFAFIGLAGAVVVWVSQDWLLSEGELGVAVLADGRRAFYLLIAYVAFLYPLRVYVTGIESVQRYDLISAYQSSLLLARSLMLISVFALGYGSISLFVGSSLAVNALTALLCRRALKRLHPELQPSLRHLDWRTARLLAIFAIGSASVVIGTILNGSGFRLFVGKRLGMSELGGFAAVITLTTMMWKLIYDVGSILPPAVSAQDAEGRESNVARILTSGTKYAVVVTVSMCLVPITVTGAFFRLWLGDEFSGLDSLVTVLLLLQVPLCLGSIAMQVLLGLGRISAGGVTLARGVVGLVGAVLYVEFVGPNLTCVVAWNSGTQVAGGIVIFLCAVAVTRQSAVRVLFEAFVRPVTPGLVGMSLVWLISSQIGVDQWWKLAVSVTAGELALFALLLAIGVDREEKRRLSEFLGAVRSRLFQGQVGAGARADGD